jgi:hypothetical protein
MEKEKVGNPKEAIYLTSLDDLQQTITKIHDQLGFNLAIKYDGQEKDSDEEVEIKHTLYRTNLWHICNARRIITRLITDNDKQKSVMMLPVYTDLCCYIGKGADHHVIQIPEQICNEIVEELVANKVQQENYIFTDLGTLHQATTNLDNEFNDIIERKYNSENWREKRHDINGWAEVQIRCEEVKRVADALISDKNPDDPVLLIKAGGSYYLGGGTEIYVIQVCSSIYSSIEDVVKKNITV